VLRSLPGPGAMERSFAANVQAAPCPWCSAHLTRGSGQPQRVSWLARRRRLATPCTARAADGGAAPPWVLMGRSVHVDASRVAEPDALWGTVVIKAKAMSTLRSEQAFTEALDVRCVVCNNARACRNMHTLRLYGRFKHIPVCAQTVLALLPGLSGRLRRVKPELLSRLVDDTNAIAARLVQLKVLFPDNTDVEQLVSNRLRPCPELNHLQLPLLGAARGARGRCGRARRAARLTGGPPRPPGRSCCWTTSLSACRTPWPSSRRPSRTRTWGAWLRRSRCSWSRTSRSSSTSCAGARALCARALRLLRGGGPVTGRARVGGVQAPAWQPEPRASPGHGHQAPVPAHPAPEPEAG